MACSFPLVFQRWRRLIISFRLLERWSEPYEIFLLLAAALLAQAQERVTEGELKLVVDSTGRHRQRRAVVGSGGFLYFVGNNKVSRMDAKSNVTSFLDPSPGANGSVVDSAEARDRLRVPGTARHPRGA